MFVIKKTPLKSGHQKTLLYPSLIDVIQKLAIYLATTIFAMYLRVRLESERLKTLFL